MNHKILFDICDLILSPEDLWNFACVCKIWNFVATESQSYHMMKLLYDHKQLYNKDYPFLSHSAVHFHWACKHGHLKLIQWIHNTQKFISYNKNDGLRRACKHGHLEIAKWLHQTFHVIPDLDLAFENKHYHVAKWIREVNSFPHFHIVFPDISKSNPENQITFLFANNIAHKLISELQF